MRQEILETLYNDCKKYPVKSNPALKRILKKLVGVYPHAKRSKLISDILKGQDASGTFKHVSDLIERYTNILYEIQTKTGKEKSSERFMKDQRIKILCRVLEQLQIVYDDVGYQSFLNIPAH